MNFSLDDRYTVRDGSIYLTGIQALVRYVRDVARDDRSRGLRSGSFVSGYEGSPLGGYDLELARQNHIFDGLDHVFQPGVNEELAATSVMGSQLADGVGSMSVDGITGYWYGKSPGLDRASDALRHANLAGTHPKGGAVAMVGDDPGGKSSSIACASEYALADLQMPTLYPADPQEVLTLGMHAVHMSRHSGLWAGFKIVTAVADGAASAVVAPDQIPHVALKPSVHRPDAQLVGANLITLERSLLSQRLPRALEYVRAHDLNRMVRSSDDRIGIVSAGKTYLDVRDALHRLGLTDGELARRGVRLLKLDMIWPLDQERIRDFSQGLDEVIVVEEKRPFIEDGVRNALFGVAGAPRVLGKLDHEGRELISPVGELDADLVTKALGRHLGDVHQLPSVLATRAEQVPVRTALPLALASRTPYFCSGCPHNSSTKVPEDSLVGGGIGCHAMVLFMDDKQTGNVSGLTQMGGEGAQWLGMAPFVEEAHFIQNIGDGTFTHSGSLAMRAAVAAGRNITYKLLYNSTVAMTGGQDAVGAFALPRMVDLLLAEGVSKIVVTSPDPGRTRRLRLPAEVEIRHRDDIVDVQSELAAVTGVTVLLHDQECAAELRRKRKRGKAETPPTRVVINERICEGCGDCGEKSNCMSVHPVESEFGRKTTIHQSSCNLDYSCLKGDCPAFVKVTVGEQQRKPARVSAPDLSIDQLTAPEKMAATDDFGIRITGIGGTGIVTVAQILATAAVVDGKQVRSLDQTGLAQKGGAVVSDLRITDRAAPGKIARAECDLYLVCDSLVATDPKNLQVADPGRTAVVASTAEIPTGQMVVDTGERFPDRDRIRTSLESVAQRLVSVDSATLAERLFGHEQYANIFLVGVAWQLGRIPVAAEALEQAIMLNGAAAATNVQAFRRGRQVISDPAAFEALLAPTNQTPLQPATTPAARRLIAAVGATSGSELHRLVTIRVQDLMDYQDTDYARDYVTFVEKVRRAEEQAAPESQELTETVARYLHKLMAYKDEYEVARLILHSGLDESVAEEFGADATYSIQLHPPMLRSVGLTQKLGFGPRTMPVFKALHRARRLRGSRFDVFGYHPVRRTERALIAEYRAAIEAVLPQLGPETVAAVVDLAALPDRVRGYEQIKLDNVATYRQELAAAQTQIRQEVDAKV